MASTTAVHGTADPAAWTPPPLRADLDAVPQAYLGRRYVIYKNPISLAYFRLPAAHAEAAMLFDGRTPLRDLPGRLAEGSRYWRSLREGDAVSELAALAGQLAQGGVLSVRGASATERSRRLRELKKSRGFELAVGKVLFFKQSLFDPDDLLGRLLPAVRWAFSPAALVLGAAFFILSLLAVAWNFDRFVAQGANFFTLSNIGLTWVLFLGVKVLHEFGHGLAAKYHGAEVHEMGFMFILFTPYLFCNVSDVWRAGKTARVAVGSAGIMVELVIASAAVWLWLFSQPGLFHQMCFNTIVLCSVSTVLFNGNPLMKFDGYYILSDILEIPNLRAKSNAWVTAWAQRSFLGLRPKTAPAAAHETNPLFGIYAVAAYTYGWFVMFSISIMLFDLLKPYGLQFVSRTYVGLFLFVSLALPLYRLGMSVRGLPEFRSAVFRRGRVLALGILLFSGLVFAVPWTETIKRSAALEAEHVEPVSASAAGILEEVRISNGAAVRRGDVLGTIRNEDLTSSRVSLGLERESLLVRLRYLASEDSPEAALSVPVAARQAREIEEEMAGLDEKLASLVLRAPRDGVLRTSRPEELEGRYFAAREPVFEVGSGDVSRVLIALDEKQARKVRPGQAVRVIFTGLPGETFQGSIVSVPPAPSSGFSAPALANLMGGDVPAEPGLDGRTLRPSMAHYEAEAQVEISAENRARLRPHASGRARIEIRRTTLAEWLWDKFYDAVNPDMRL